MKYEYRSFELTETVADEEKRTLTGKAVPYGSESKPLRTMTGDEFVEVIRSGAAATSLANNDILALKNHDTGYLLGRTSAGTLKLSEREDGIYFELELPETSYGNDTLVSAKRGDLRNMSFGFIAKKQSNTVKGGKRVREILEMDLREISVVAAPAYNDTSVSVRSEDFANEDNQPEAQAEPEAPAQAVDDTKDKDLALRHRFTTLTHKQ